MGMQIYLASLQEVLLMKMADCFTDKVGMSALEYGFNKLIFAERCSGFPSNSEPTPPLAFTRGQN